MSYTYFDYRYGPTIVEDIFTRGFCRYAWDASGVLDDYSDRFYKLVTTIVRRATNANSMALWYDMRHAPGPLDLAMCIVQ
jgi:hypothetical protein